MVNRAVAAEWDLRDAAKRAGSGEVGRIGHRPRREAHANLFTRWLLTGLDKFVAEVNQNFNQVTLIFTGQTS